MDESRFLALMRNARTCSYLGGSPDYWHGYQRGLRRGFHGELFGTDDEHERWMHFADDGRDIASRDRGRGYRDGLSACGVDAERGTLGSALGRDGGPEDRANRADSSRR